MSQHQDNELEKTPGYTTETELVRRYDRPVKVSDAVTSTVTEAIDQWSELSTSPPLWEFVDADKLDGLFKTKANDDSTFRPSVEFNFQGCRVVVLYGPSIRVIIDRYP
ncbi:MAG: hypothetical protein A07HR60_00059 [uncultured archaeon A07HR60]|nr:MAG: hypothetical protein A07HR60_00059 [uncultured archaeon A07HR60]